MKIKYAFFEKTKLKNALPNLIKYISFLELVSFVLLFLGLFLGLLAIFFGIVNGNYVFLRTGLIMLLVTVTTYIFIVKPILLIMYAVCKMLIQTKKREE